MLYILCRGHVDCCDLVYLRRVVRERMAGRTRSETPGSDLKRAYRTVTPSVLATTLGRPDTTVHEIDGTGT